MGSCSGHLFSLNKESSGVDIDINIKIYLQYLISGVLCCCKSYCPMNDIPGCDMSLIKSYRAGAFDCSTFSRRKYSKKGICV